MLREWGGVVGAATPPSHVVGLLPDSPCPFFCCAHPARLGCRPGVAAQIIDGDIQAWPEVATWPNSTVRYCTVTAYESKVPLIVPKKESLLWAVNSTGVTVSGVGTVHGGGEAWWAIFRRLPQNQCESFGACVAPASHATHLLSIDAGAAFLRRLAPGSSCWLSPSGHNAMLPRSPRPAADWHNCRPSLMEFGIGQATADGPAFAPRNGQ